MTGSQETVQVVWPAFQHQRLYDTGRNLSVQKCPLLGHETTTPSSDFESLSETGLLGFSAHVS